MSLTDTGGTGMYMPVAPAYGGNGGFGNMWGGDGWWVILFLFALMGNGFGGFGGFGGNGMFNIDFPWLMNGQQAINTNTNSGFQNALLNDNITAVRSGIADISTQLCGGFAGVNATVTNAQNAVTQQLYTNEIADLERSFAAQTANTQGISALQAQLAQCCCDNRQATADVKYTLATEACNTRAANTANTQAILDKLCQLELDGFKRENDQLRAQLNLANLQASQVAQTADLRNNNATVANQLVSELRSCPIPSQPVYGNQPIFSYGNTCTCNG